MNTRRLFLSRLGAMVAVVALAPQIAFGHKLDVQPKLDLQELFDAFYEIVKFRKYQPEIDILTDRAGLDALEKSYPGCFDHGDIPAITKFQTPNRRVIGVYEQLRVAS